MGTDRMETTDAVMAALDMGRALQERPGLVGYGIAELFDTDIDENGLHVAVRRKMVVPFANLITDAGDLYTAGMVIALVSPANAAQPTKANGMKLGTGSTAVAKSGAGGAIVTYLTASNVAFDATFPVTANLGAGLGVNAQYKTTWAAGIATNSAIAEAAIVNDQANNASGSSAANTYSRTVFGSTINKGASDTLAVTWNWKYLGA